MKIKLFLFILFLGMISACNYSGKKGSYSFLHTLVDSAQLDTCRNIIVYTINPNDCINCLIGFTEINKNMSGIPNPELFIISVEREVEKNELARSMSRMNIKDTINKTVVWDKQLFDKVNRLTKRNLPISLINVYSYQKDSILFSKPIKEVVDVNNLKKYFVDKGAPSSLICR